MCLIEMASYPQRNQSSSRTGIGAGELLHEPSRLFVFVGFSDNRRLALVVRFGVVVVVLVLVIVGVSRRHRVAHDHEGTPVDQPGGKFLGDVWGHVVAPRVWTLGDFTPSTVIRHANLTPLALQELRFRAHRYPDLKSTILSSSR